MNDKIDNILIYAAILIFAALVGWGCYDAGKQTSRRNAAKAGAGHYAINPLTGGVQFYYHSNTNQP